MNQGIRVGIAGYGIVGRRRHACITETNGIEVVAVCDQDPSTSISLAADVRFHSDYQSLFEEDLDAVFVCMSNDITAAVTVAALESGRHVFCEKPPARTMEELAQVITVERTHPDLKLMYGFNHRYHESVEDALRIVRSRELGEVVSLRGVYGKSQLLTFDQPGWRTRREIAGGGVLLDQGIHMVDLIRLFGGEFNEVHSCVSNGHWGYDVEDNAYALMRSSDGVVATVTSSATQWRHQFSLDITLTKGSLILGGILTSSKSYGSETLTIVTANPSNDRGDPREQMTKYNEDVSWMAEVRAFQRVVAEDLPVDSGTSDDAIRTLALVYEIYYQDAGWRDRFEIENPQNILDQLGITQLDHENGS